MGFPALPLLSTVTALKVLIRRCGGPIRLHLDRIGCVFRRCALGCGPSPSSPATGNARGGPNKRRCRRRRAARLRKSPSSGPRRHQHLRNAVRQRGRVGRFARRPGRLCGPRAGCFSELRFQCVNCAGRQSARRRAKVVHRKGVLKAQSHLAHRAGCLHTSVVSDNTPWTRSCCPRRSAPP